MKEADEIYVLDTGSTDNTVSLLKEAGVHVKQEIISPWRFDVARNKSLELVPDDCDICVCTDFDEVFERGWREKLKMLGMRILLAVNILIIGVWTKKTNQSLVSF